MIKKSSLGTSAVWALLALSTAGVAAAREPELLSLSADHFSQTTTVLENAPQGTITVSTEKGFVERHGLMRTVWDDEFLRAVLNRNTGQKAFAVEVSFTYTGAHRDYQSAVFIEDGASRSVPITEHRSESLNCPTGECTVTEYLSFPVEERMLRALAAGNSGSAKLWAFKIAGPPKKEYQGALSSAEIAGLLARVDEESGAVRTLDARGQPVAEVPRDLGVAGMAIEGGDETPPRGGLLLTAVNRGSVAQKAGLLVGDMVYEIDGRPIKSPNDLTQAVARTHLKPTVTIKMYRGREKLSVAVTF
jgi:hypothetical protein